MILSVIISEDEYLAHYGRKGMKWYEHIFGDENDRYTRKSNRINRKIGRLEKKQQKNEYNASRFDEDIFKLNKKLKRRTTGLGLLLYDSNSEKEQSIRSLLDYNKEQRDMFLTEAMRYSSLIDRQYDKLDRLNVKYGKELVDRKMRER